MKAAAVAVLALAASGCVLGTQTSMVGVWRPQRKVDTVVCVEQAPGNCARTVKVARDLPARSFGGGTLGLFESGYVHVANGSRHVHRYAANSHYEYLRGRGAFAVGVRAGANFAIATKSFAFSLPITVVGHFGFSRFSFFGGAGYTPTGREWGTVDDARKSSGLHGFNVLGGARAVLRPARTARLTTNLVVSHEALGDTSLTSVTAALGIDY